MSDILTTKQLAERWGVSEGTLHNQRSKGTGPVFVKLGNGRNASVRYRLEDIKQYEIDQRKGTQ